MKELEKKWNNLTPKQQAEELEKCKQSTAYFYNKYIRKEGMREITDEEIDALRKQAECPIKRRVRPDSYPFTYK